MGNRADRIRKLQQELKKRKKLRYYRNNPLDWMVDRLNIDRRTIRWSDFPAYKSHDWDDKDPDLITPDPLYQMLTGLANKKDVGVEAGTGVGKTFLAAAVCLWFVDCWPMINDPKTGEVLDPGARVITVATKENQLRKVIWREIENFKPVFSDMHPQAEWMDLGLRMNPDRESGSKEGWGVFGMTASVSSDEEVSTKFSGLHGPHMLFVMDEAPGINKPILEAIENTCTANHNLRLALGNPKSQNDTLHKFCTQKRVKHIRASALDHPNVVLGEELVTGAVTRKSVRRRLDKYDDPDHRIILRRVHGVSPSTSGTTLFPDKAIRKSRQYVKKGPIKRWKVRPPANGDLRVYRKRKKDKLNRYVIFADVAGDRSDQGDWHAAVVLDRGTREICAVLHMRGPRTNYVAELMKLARLYVVPYGTTGSRKYDAEKGEFVREKHHYWPLLAYEVDAVGGLHLDDRIKEYENLYHRRRTDTQEDSKPRKAVGWSTNRSTRPDMIDSLEDWALSLLEHPERLPDKNLWNEARTFIFDPSDGKDGKWKADSGCHDDVVMATAGALTVDSVTDSYMRPVSDFEESDDKQKDPKMPPKMNPKTGNPYDADLPDYGSSTV
jgi:hypothetical protein